MQSDQNTHSLPSLSIIIVTFNCESVLEKCLSYIERQNYPEQLIEILVVDGGSCDRTLDIAKAHNTKVIEAGFPDNQEARRCIASILAKNEILVYIDSDNFLPTEQWLLQMVEPFCQDEKIIATQTLHYTYEPHDTLMNRYAALFGGKDPVPFYFGKQDRLPWTVNSWNIAGKVIKETEKYYIVEFDADIPTLGCNGFLIKKDVLLEANCSPGNFFHTDVLQDLIEKGYTRYAIVKNSVIHLISGGFLVNLKKRYLYMFRLNQNMKAQRRYMIYDAGSFSDNMKLLKYIFYTLTMVKPLYDSFRGYLQIKDFAWFLHLPMCWGTLLVYGFAVIQSLLSKNLSSVKY